MQKQDYGAMSPERWRNKEKRDLWLRVYNSITINQKPTSGEEQKAAMRIADTMVDYLFQKYPDESTNSGEEVELL